jgi:hypothetical protein
VGTAPQRVRGVPNVTSRPSVVVAHRDAFSDVSGNASLNSERFRIRAAGCLAGSTISGSAGRIGC